jgi:two-component sensor histidine kinase
MDCNGNFAAIAFPADPILSVREADHRIANSLGLLAGVVQTRAREFAKLDRMIGGQEVSRVLKDVRSQIVAIGQLHRALATGFETTHLDLNLHLWKLCKALLEALAEPGQFSLVRDANDPCVLRIGKILPICLIATEVVTNAIKYSHPSGVKGCLAIGCQHGLDGSILVEIADDGVGLPEKFDPVRDGGIGATMISLLARDLAADVSYHSGPTGLRFTMRLPRSALA